jgi:hypothetical protein
VESAACEVRILCHGHADMYDLHTSDNEYFRLCYGDAGYVWLKFHISDPLLSKCWLGMI